MQSFLNTVVLKDMDPTRSFARQILIKVFISDTFFLSVSDRLKRYTGLDDVLVSCLNYEQMALQTLQCKCQFVKACFEGAHGQIVYV